MSTVIITYDAKCKHCKWFKYFKTINKNGKISKKSTAFCTNTNSIRYNNETLTLKTLVCNKIEL